MTSIARIAIGVFAVVGILATAVSSASARAFEDKFGRTIEAELVSHTGAKAPVVKINKDGKEMEVKVSIFSAKDQAFIRQWMTKTPPTISYAFRVEASKKVADTARSKAYYEKGKSAETNYELKITNLSRQTVSGIRIEYKVFMRNNGDPSSYGGFNTASGTLMNVTDKVKVDSELAYNRSAVINTKSLRIDSARGSFSSSNFTDELLGVIVRVYDPENKMVTEWRTPNRAFEKIAWSTGGGSSEAPKVVIE